MPLMVIIFSTLINQGLYAIIILYRVTVNLQYKEELVISNGEHFWDCNMVYESPQSGWKIEGFFH